MRDSLMKQFLYLCLGGILTLPTSVTSQFDVMCLQVYQEFQKPPEDMEYLTWPGQNSQICALSNYVRNCLIGKYYHKK